MTLMTALILTSSSGPKDKDDHTLTGLWKDYYAAEGADKPKTQEAALLKIKEEAKAKHLTWDYYDASMKLAQVRISGNWKLRENETAARDADIIAFGEPVAEYFLDNQNYWKFMYVLGGATFGSGNEGRAFIEKNKAALQSSHNPEFYSRDFHISGREFGKILPDLLANDYEYCLWSFGDPELLTAEFKDYPLSAFAEFAAMGPAEKSFRQNLEAFARKWDGKAAGLLAEQELLTLRFDELNKSENGVTAGSSDDFRQLRDDCLAFNKKRSAFKGEEKKIADCLTRSDILLDNLNSKSVSVNVLDGTATITLGNLDAVTLQVLKDGKTVFEKYLTNPVKSYYIPDKLALTLPDLDDGSYEVKCFNGKTEETVDYHKFTISATIRRNASGIGVWAADFISGEPLGKVSVDLLKDGKAVQSANLVLDGYTNIPESFISGLADRHSRYSLQVRSDNGKKRASQPVSLYYYDNPAYSDEPERLNACLITDRGAYAPDDTLHFKAVIYKGKYSLQAADDGLKVTAELADPSGKTLESKDLTTNEFGSVAADFKLLRGERNGYFRIILKHGGQVLASRTVRVDDYVLPTFDLVFDKESLFYKPVGQICTGGSIYSYSGHPLTGADISYTITHNGGDFEKGKLVPDSKGRFELKFAPDSTNTGYDWYHINIKVVDATGETMEWNKSVNIYPQPVPVVKSEFYFDEKNEDGNLDLKVVAGSKPVWMIVEAHGTGNKLLWKRIEHFIPSDGPASTSIKYRMKDSDPDAIEISVLYFQDKKSFSHSSSLRKTDHRWDLPLEFTRFLDTTVPGSSYTFEIKTLAGVELAASIFDKSTERFYPNTRSNIRAMRFPGPSITRDMECGTDQSSYRMMVRGLGRSRLMSKAATANVLMAAMDSAPAEDDAIEIVDDAIEVEEAIPLDEGAYEAEVGVPIRENFANTIAWEPFLRSDSEGRVQFSFTNADKLSTYNVQLFAHDRQMKNEVLRREMMVTIPVKISLAEPRFLYEGDVYKLRVALSSSLSKDVRGTLSVSVLDGSDYKTAKQISSVSRELTVPGRSGAAADFDLTAEGLSVLGLKITFKPSDNALGGDGVFVSVPVSKAVQTLTEAHSAVLPAGADKAALEKELRAMFSNFDGSQASLREISIFDMLGEAIPAEVKARSDNAIELSKALYAYSLCTKLGQNPEFDRDGTVKKLLDCRDGNGGFGWFAGMQASPIVTAVVLTRLRGLGIIEEEAAVRYIDSQYFAKDRAGWWYRGLSLEQYLSVRSLFPEVAFVQKTDSGFRKDAKAYLVPKKVRGLNGRPGEKARRVIILENFLASSKGTALAKKLGIKLGTAGKLRKSLAADIESLVEYAQPHKSGGCYYPNAVMPWRGLLETELDAHCDIAGIMERHSHADIADGIRLWIMIQKETQNWSAEPGYIEALAMVLSGPDSILQTKVLALKGTYEVPFAEVKASGNGMEMSSLAIGQTLRVGDRVKLTFNISNEENRSFVKVTVPFGAGLLPVNQMSGYRWGYYRNVLPDRIELWYEVYPEEKTVITEEFYATRAGEFRTPAAEIVCEYADHYRANTAAIPILSIQQQ